MNRSLVLLIGVLVLWPAPCGTAWADDATRPVPEKLRVERLARLGRLWGTVRYVHPFLAYRDLDWDAPLIKAIPKVEAARTRDEYAAAVGEMLAALGDPATTVSSQDPRGKPTDGEGQPVWSWLDGKILVVRITNYLDLERDFLAARGKMERLKPVISKSEGILFDLRALTPGTQPGMMTGVFQPIGNWLVSREVVGPAERSLLHSGYMPQTGMTSGGYFSAFVTPAATRFVPEPGAKARRVAFVVNARSELPHVALALQGSGDAALIAEGPLSDSVFVTTTGVDLGEGVAARVRTTEYVAGPGGPAEIRADVQVTPCPEAGPSIPSYEAALNFLRGGLDLTQPGRTARVLPALVVPRADRTYQDNEYPGREYRLLAAFRFWNVIHYFFPYKHLIGEDWDAILDEFIPKLEAARDAREYALALAEMATHTRDSHVSVRARALAEFFGTAAPPVELREIEGEPVVTRLGTVEAVKASGLGVGDVVLKIDGEPVRDRMRRLGRYITASTPQAHTRMILSRLLGGSAGSRITLTVRDRDGHERERPLIRLSTGAFFGLAGDGEVLQLLEGNIGYADLRRLTVAQVDAMFERFQDAKGIIFDMRGYPRGTAWAIAPRINTKGARHAAEFRRPFVAGEGFSYGSFHFLQPIPARNGKPLYRGKTVMLIDERAISQAEHTGLFFEAANGTTFIGSPTAGANGDVTTLTVPGGIVISFSGHDVRHADGRQVQRVGLVPHIEVRPTIRGIRDGRDEVLERARKSVLETAPDSGRPKAKSVGS
jgi:C-terminal processing protease CtpA/Prc